MFRTVASIVLTVLVLGTLPAVACMAPMDFNPRHLVEASTEVFTVKIVPPDAEGICVAEVQGVLKGKAPARPLAIDTASGPMKEVLEDIRRRVVKHAAEPAILFVGKNEDNNDSTLLHVGGRWVILSPKADRPGTLVADTYSEHMEDTWSGGTDGLIRITEQALRHPDIVIPKVAGVNWARLSQAGKVDGKVSRAQAVDLVGDGRLALFVASDKGDAVFSCNAKTGKFADIAPGIKLASKSRAAAWGDFNGDGRLDLASWNGKALVVWSQGEDGTFAASKPVEAAPKVEPVGLCTVDVGVEGRAGLLWSSAYGAPVLLVSGADGAFSAKTLEAGAADAGKLGQAVGALVADFDGDGLADVIQPFASGSLFYKGSGAGRFEPAAELPIALGPGRANAFVGDWDMDGRFDIYGVSEAGCSLWENRGGTTFVNAMDDVGANLTGEMAYIAQPGGIGGNVCDFNNDGLQDVFLVYGDKRTLFFFNRGFSSFRHGHSLDIEEQQEDNLMLAQASEGQQAGLCADLNGDGAQDQALVLHDGGVWVFLRDGLEHGSTVSGLRVALAPGGTYAGPVTVTAEDDRGILLGAWNVSPGSGDAWICRAGGGDLTVSWRFPGGESHEKRFSLVDKPLRFVLPAGTDQKSLTEAQPGRLSPSRAEGGR